MKALTTTFNILLTLLLVAIGGLFLASLIPMPGNIEIKIVKSGSMEPAIKTGSIVVIKPQTTAYGAQYRVGDIITFGPDNAREIPTTHRVEEVIKDSTGEFTYRTKGDANEEADPGMVLESEVIGQVVFDTPYVGYILDFAKKPVGFALLIGIPAAVIILDELIVIGREFVKLRRKKEVVRDREEEVLYE